MIGPSGEQFEIGFDDQTAVVVEVGGGLRTYRAGDREIVDGYPAGAMCGSGRGQVLIPWPNRLQDGCYDFRGRRHQLPINEAATHTAIHGLVRWAGWAVSERGPDRVVMSHVLHPQPGYPFTLALRIEYQLSAAGLSVQTTATNAGQHPCPYGCGAHPYLNAGTPTIDTATLELPAATVLASDDRGIPVGTRPVGGTEYDFRAPRPIGATMLDHAFTDLERGDDDLARVRLSGQGNAVTLWVDNSYPYLMVFSGDLLADVNRRSLAVEPMSCPPNAFNTGEGLICLEPGQSHVARWGIDPFDREQRRNAA